MYKRYYKKYGNKLACFSPPVMILTFLIEFGFAIYVLWRYKLNTVSRLVTAMLICLGLFQAAEYMICGGLGMTHVEWARLGYISITLLPAIGIHLLLALAKEKMYPLLVAAYGSAIAYVAYFATIGSSVVSRECSPNYAVFQTQGWEGMLYVVYYYGWLLATLVLATYLASKKPKLTPVMRWMALGYVSFIVPTTVANIMDPKTVHAIPSIMCGFAVLFACVLVWRVLPLSKVPVAKR
jgi:hypothetical protein